MPRQEKVCTLYALGKGNREQGTSSPLPPPTKKTSEAGLFCWEHPGWTDIKKERRVVRGPSENATRNTFGREK